MVEGDSVFKEAISYLKSIKPLPALEWDENLAASAMEHVSDIGPKGLLLYQSSDGTEPEDRIGKYGTYSESLGENIDFGPNDALGVIISLTLDDGEEQRPHRENLFKSDYRKVGIACGPHKTEFQMCVMDFAYDFFPPTGANKNLPQKNLGGYNNNPVVNISLQDKENNYENEYKIPMNKGDMLNNSNYANAKNNNNYEDNAINNTSPLVKLSLEPEDVKKAKKELMNNQNYGYKPNQNTNNNLSLNIPQNEIEDLANKTKNIMNNLAVREKKVEIITKITYVFEDGSTKEVSQSENHTFKF